MNILLFFNLITSLLVNDKTEIAENFFPTEQIAEKDALNYSSDYVYSSNGELIEALENKSGQDKFFVITDDNELVEINLIGSKITSIGSEIGYLARILSSEALIYEKSGSYHNISMYTRVCIAESIRNRKNSDFGFYADYKTYRSVIFYTGYATYGKEFKDTHKWLKNQVAKKRFVQEILPPAIFIYFNETNFTNNATGFITPSKLTLEKYNKFKKRNLIEIANIDPYYEFTFWKY
jgi:hypothetical protein